MRPQRDSRKVIMSAVMPGFRPDLRLSAFLLDVDGTLVDIAPTPREVRVPAPLLRTLARLIARTDGAVALVSGRSIADLDRLFDPLRLTAVGGHGAEFRLPDGTDVHRRDSPALGAELKQALFAIAGAGVLAEDKGYSVALHYRLAPEKEALVREAVARACARAVHEPVEILPGKAVIEIKPAGFSKGSGVRELMRHAPFAGRRPIFIGDDTTDETVFAIMPELDGTAFSVGRDVAGVAGCFATPARVRAWLDRIAPAGESVAQ